MKRRIRVECDPRKFDVPNGRADESIVSAASGDHKKAPDGFILSPVETNCCDGLYTDEKPQKKTDDLSRNIVEHMPTSGRYGVVTLATTRRIIGM
ncbi:hypothetical protein [Paraburkholderia fynbosensis]|uniref:hypothetical protein n=1 Tax=Paraburkholderia fynbosensis TaxID=1200993 RepID=UPI001583549B|nr:hypothetical protein [Paraburkholderia fynbosensis]